MDGELIDRMRVERFLFAAMTIACARTMQWGRDDCALWCADVLYGALGYDAAADFRGRYRSERGARRVLGKGGLAGVLKRAASRHRWVRVPPAYAQTGDIGLIVTKRGVSTVICRARGWFVGRDERGIAAVPARMVRVAWSIDRNDVVAEPGVRVSFPRIPTRPEISPTSVIVHEPISTTIGLSALLFNAGIGATVGAATAIGGAIIGGAVAVGLSLASSLLAPKPTGSGAIGDIGQSSAQSNQDIQFTERQALPSKRVIVGEAYVGGALFYEQARAPYLYMGLLLSVGPIAGVDKIFIGTNQLLFQNLGFSSILVPLQVSGQPDYPNHLQVSLRNGSVSQTLDTLLATDFAGEGISANFRQQGIATAVFRYAYGADYNQFTALWGQVQRPNAYLLVRGVPAYDPRDPTQDVNDEGTWKWTNNASLVQAYYLTRPFGGRISVDKIRWDKVAAAADWDDGAVACADGTFIKRYTCDGAITLNQKPSDILTSMLTANRGYVLQSGGKYWVSSSKPKTPIATIYDAILAGPIQIRSAKPKSDLINKLQVRFVAQEQDYQTIDGPILERIDLEADDLETLTATLELPFTLDYRRAERLQKAYLATARLGKTINCTVDIALMADLDDELIGNAVTVDSDLFPTATGTYLVTAVAFADDCTTLALTLTEYDSSIETDWNAQNDEMPFTVTSPFTL